MPIFTFPAAACVLAITLLFHNSAVLASTKIAFIGDQGARSNARAVLSLVASEGTDLLLIQGDLGYTESSATAWEENLTNALGSDFPVLTVVGNHENFEWPLYQRLIQQRIDRIAGLSCSGNTGVKAVCQFDNIDVVQIAPGITEVAGINPDDNYENFIRSSLSSSSNRWRICSWHKNQRNMQPGGKGDSTGWAIYDACLDAGAIIGMAHSHAYSRTHLLSDFENRTVVHKRSDMTITPGQSFAFVSGLGGRDVVPQQHGGDWFASIYTASQGATHGALFCTFEQTTADCYFKAIDGAVPDQFTLNLRPSGESTADSQASPPPPASGFTQGYVFSRTDKSEYRWIDRDSSGNLGNIWIDQACADRLGGVTATGDWHKLNELAPGFDAIANPCSGLSATSSAPNELNTPNSNNNSEGYVFSRSDKKEYRWIARNSTGILGNIWISKQCADRLGGATASGDWSSLIQQSPGFDSIQSPCK